MSPGFELMVETRLLPLIVALMVPSELLKYSRHVRVGPSRDIAILLEHLLKLEPFGWREESTDVREAFTSL